MGYIYIMANPLWGNNIYKIGMTKDLKGRIKSFHTYLPTDTEYVYTREINDASLRKNEQEIHLQLQDYRIQYNKEFFNIELKSAIEIIENIGEDEFDNTKIEIETLNKDKENHILKQFLKINEEKKPF